MDGSFSVKKQTIIVGLGLLLAADLGLAAYSWQASTALRTPMAQLESDSRKLTLLSADIDHAEKIRHDLPATVADCDRFEASLPLSTTGNSAIDAELDDLAKKAGVQIQSLGLRHKDLPARNLTQIDLDSTVSGDYNNIVKFMNSLQRSKTFYIVESLSLQEEGQGGPSKLRIALHLKTYFRTAA
jgi:type IV pilus assembly protein PilO